MTGQDSNCTLIGQVTLSTWLLYSNPLLSALNEIQHTALEAYPGAVIGANDGAIQAASDNMQDSFGSLLDFDSNGYFYGSSGFSDFQSSLPVLGGPSGARTSSQSV